MLHSLYLIKKTGECLFYRKYGKFYIDENLLAGFISAISTVAEGFSSQGIDAISLRMLR